MRENQKYGGNEVQIQTNDTASKSGARAQAGGQQDFRYFTTPDSYCLACHETKPNE